MFLIPVSRHPRLYSRSFDRWFDESFDRLLGRVDGRREVPHAPALDVAETDSTYTVSLDLPGVSRDQVNVSIEGRRVSVEARSEHGAERKDGDRIIWRERSDARYARQFVLPAELDGDASTAKLENGVLELTLVKRSPKVPAKIAVN